MSEFDSIQKDHTSPSSGPVYLNNLNESQKKAVLHTDGPLLIIAGAGSGKTRVLTCRIARLLDQKKAKSHEILALTFTNKAAREMQERIVDLIGSAGNQLWMGTFHSIFSRFLRYESDLVGYTSDYSIYDTADSDRLIKTILLEIGYRPREIKPSEIRRIISSAKNQLIKPDEFKNLNDNRYHFEIAGRVYERYVNRCKKNNAMDFDDLLIKPIELFEKHPEVLKKYQERFRYILIDEYQDTNHAQYRATKLLASLHKNICVVGDDSQSIYAFRGADITNILNFESDYPEAEKIPLEQNYRSTKYILQCADSVIKNNRNRLDKTLWTNNNAGEVITLLENFDERDEANRIAKYIMDYRYRHQLKFRDFTVLYRTNYQSRVFEDAFRRRSIPYQLIGGISFYQRKEVKDVLAALRLMLNPEDDESLIRVLSEFPLRIGDKSISRLLQAASDNNHSLWNTLSEIESISVYKPAIPQIRNLVNLLLEAKNEMDHNSMLETTRFLLEKTGYTNQLMQEHSHDSIRQHQNVMELLNAISYFEKSKDNPSFSLFLQEISLFTDLDEHDTKKDKVTLMTVHGSKGLEFPVVFIAGLEEDLFPIGSDNGDTASMEEERRLFYVAITRAEKHLFFSYAKSRYRFGKRETAIRSQFLNEVDHGVVRTETGASIRRRSYSSFKSSDFAGLSGKPTTNDFSEEKSTVDFDLHVEYDNEESMETLKPGILVIHPKFGPGKILQCEGEGEEAKITVFFKKKGQKKLLAKFANLQIIG